MLLYTWYFITNYTAGILLLVILRVSCLRILWSHATLLMAYLITDYTHGILPITLRVSCLIILWSCATLLMVYYYLLYSWYIITDYTGIFLFNNVVNRCYFSHGILLLIIQRLSCLIMLSSWATLLMVYYYWLYLMLYY